LTHALCLPVDVQAAAAALVEHVLGIKGGDVGESQGQLQALAAEIEVRCKYGSAQCVDSQAL
jgi:hypothetical protein